MSLNKPTDYNEQVAAALTKALKASKGDADILAEIVAVHTRTLGRLLALIAIGDKDHIKRLITTVNLGLHMYAEESAEAAQELLNQNTEH